MIKVSYKFPRATAQVEGEVAKDIFRSLSDCADMLSESACGRCMSENIRPDVRDVDSFTYYCLVCLDCGARLDYGQRKEGGSVFPKRKPQHTKSKGWYQWSAGVVSPDDD